MPRSTPPPPETAPLATRPVISVTAGRGQRLAQLVPGRRAGGSDPLPWLLIPCIALALLLKATAPADASAAPPSPSAGIAHETP